MEATRPREGTRAVVHAYPRRYRRSILAQEPAPGGDASSPQITAKDGCRRRTLRPARGCPPLQRPRSQRPDRSAKAQVRFAEWGEQTSALTCALGRNPLGLTAGRASPDRSRVNNCTSRLTHCVRSKPCVDPSSDRGTERPWPWPLRGATLTPAGGRGGRGPGSSARPRRAGSASP